MTQPICKICGKPVERFIKSSNKWWDWCSNKCMGKDPTILAKKEKTNFEKFGSHPMHSKKCRQKLKDKFIEKYGVDNPSKSLIVKNKMKQSFMKKYRVDNPSKDPTIIKKIRNKAIENYSNIDSKNNILQKRKNTYLQSIGVSSNKQIHIPKESIKLMKDIEWLQYQHFDLKKSISQIAKELKISSTPLLTFLAKSNIKTRRHSQSQFEKEVINFLKNLGINLLQNDRTIINPQELDIFLPDQKIAIELNGIYWHSEEHGKDKNYHLLKTKNCEKQGIHLIHIYDTEWADPILQQIVKSKLAHLLNKSKRIYARQCIIKEISNTECTKFLKSSHIQGSCPAKIKLGLFFNDILCGVGTFGKARFNKKFEWELLRYSTSLNTTIVGGLSKIISFFIKTYNSNSIISYADRRWTYSNKNLYKSLNFNLLNESLPNYKYFKLTNKTILESRNKYQKHKLEKQLQIFDSTLSESENMLLNGYFKIWDCGNLVYAWNKN